MKIGRRLAIKVLNASKFALSFGAADEPLALDPALVTVQIDRAMLAGLADVVDKATAALESLRPHPRARAVRDVLLDVLRRLPRAGQGPRVRRPGPRDRLRPRRPGDRPRRAAAPVRPGAAVRHRGGLVVVARGLGAPRAVARRRAAAHRRRPAGVVTAAGSALAALRKVKSEAKVSMRTEITAVELAVPAALRPGVEVALDDVRAAGRVVGTLTLVDGDGEACVRARRRPGPARAEGLTCASSARRHWSSSTPAASIPGLLAERLARDPSGVFAERLVDGAWTSVTVSAFAAEVTAVAKGLVARGIEPGDRVAHHVPHPLRVDAARLRAAGPPGALGVPVYETSSAEQVRWIAADAGVRLALVETAKHAARRRRGPRRPARPGRGAGHRRRRGRDARRGRTRRSPTRRSPAAARSPGPTTWRRSSTPRARPAAPRASSSPTATSSRSRATASPASATSARPPARARCCSCRSRTCSRGSSRCSASPRARARAHARRQAPARRPGRRSSRRSSSRCRACSRRSTTRPSRRPARARRSRCSAGPPRPPRTTRARSTPSGPGAALRTRHALAGRLVHAKLRAALGGRAQYAISGGAPLGERLGHFYRGIGVEVLEGYGLTETTAPTAVNRPGADQGRHRRPRVPRHGPAGRRRRARSSSRAPTCSAATGTTPRPPRRRSSTAGSARATSARSTTTATCKHHRPHQGDHRHRGRQERRPRRARGPPARPPARQPGRRRRRPAPVHRRPGHARRRDAPGLAVQPRACPRCPSTRPPPTRPSSRRSTAPPSAPTRPSRAPSRSASCACSPPTSPRRTATSRRRSR